MYWRAFIMTVNYTIKAGVAYALRCLALYIGISMLPFVLILWLQVTHVPGVEAMIWMVAALLAFQLPLVLWKEDRRDGTLDQLRLTGVPMPVFVLAKVTACWIIAGLPLLLISPVLEAASGVGGEAASATVLSLLIGTPIVFVVAGVLVFSLLYRR